MSSVAFSSRRVSSMLCAAAAVGAMSLMGSNIDNLDSLVAAASKNVPPAPEPVKVPVNVAPEVVVQVPVNVELHANPVDAVDGFPFKTAASKWYDLLVNYAKTTHQNEYHLLRAASKLTANQRNLRDKMIPAIDAIQNEVLAINLKQHAVAVKDLAFKGEFSKAFSKSKADVSAASEFFELIGQAINTGIAQS